MGANEAGARNRGSLLANDVSNPATLFEGAVQWMSRREVLIAGYQTWPPVLYPLPLLTSQLGRPPLWLRDERIAHRWAQFVELKSNLTRWVGLDS